ncbi:MAG: hypothetical protein A2W05_11495 [Candidatus Schekmanbacteria bacterium RBG_16_38_10]|uniref:Uncharacterized protein n=1 Tax=Candidatus Schekmanbacteria bacterium RBG_16_38_10 TaxID=1817879 RepID=A0A1F7S1X8_9BACT|nr:MAG: hypothetical protein A2W05_11495 [Candidatus Schekmanbacteria bacterium RBG_16_38_10]
MKTLTKKVSELTVDELKGVIHEVIAEDFAELGETFAILANKKIMRQIKQADKDWASKKNNAYTSWDKVKSV